MRMTSLKNGRLLNSMLAGAAMFGAAMLTPLKINADTINPSEKIEMADKGAKEDIALSKDELKIAKFIWANLKDYENSSSMRELNIEVDAILKTLNTRLKTFKEGSSLADMLTKISKINSDKYEFSTSSPLTKSIAEKVLAASRSAESYEWDNPNVVFHTSKTWEPDDVLKAKFEFKKAYYSEHFMYWSVIPKTPTLFNLDNMTEDEKFLAKVIYSETSTICTPQEVKLVCKVIMNRIGKKDFANGGKTPKTALDVVKVKNAFSCINDKANSNWTQFKPKLNKATKRDSIYAHFMMQNNQKAINLPSEYDDIVYYHDKSISCPKAWTNRYWKPELVVETDHFKFYRIVPNKNK